jgi:hypothetical protein
VPVLGENDILIDVCTADDIERGYVAPSPEELARIAFALDELIEAESFVDRVAASVDWPGVHRDR